jgi:hypothetical protein
MQLKFICNYNIASFILTLVASVSKKKKTKPDKNYFIKTILHISKNLFKNHVNK